MSTHCLVLVSNSCPARSHSHMKEPSTFSQRAGPHTPGMDTHSSSSETAGDREDRAKVDKDQGERRKQEKENHFALYTFIILASTSIH